MSFFSLLEGKLACVSWEIVCAVGAVAVSLSFLFAVWIGKEFFLSSVSLFGSVFLALALIKKMPSDGCALLFLGIVAFGAVGYFLLCAVEKIRARSAEKRRKRTAAKAVGLQNFNRLPDGENAFLKERLLTELSDKNAAGETVVSSVKDVKLGFVYRMLAELKKAPLSAADRLERENLSEKLKKYAEKEGLTGSELRSFNDSMSAVLKLSAKYAL